MSEIIMALIIGNIVLLYLISVHYKFHNHDYIPLSFIFGGLVLFLIGFYGIFIDYSIKFFNIKIIYSITSLFLISTIVLVNIAARKLGFVKEVDITLAWIKDKLGLWAVYTTMILWFPAFFFIIAGTYEILEGKYVYLWEIIFIAWFFSGVRLLRKL